MRDTALVLRDGSTNLTADENLTFTVPRIYHNRPLAVYVLLPQDLAEASDTLKITVKSTTTLKKIEVTHTDIITQGTGTYPKTFILPLPPINAQAWTVNLDITDNDAGADFDAGAVQVWVEELAADAFVDATS
jgi:hypothetical protein